MQLQTVLAQIRGRATQQQTATLNTIKQQLTTLQTQAGGNNAQITQLQNLVTWVLTNYAWNRVA
jgi:iron-sulfur cluster repair protein YtfE (RIC family)